MHAREKYEIGQNHAKVILIRTETTLSSLLFIILFQRDKLGV